MSFCFTFDAYATTMHEYQRFWKAAFGKKLKCVREVGSRSYVFDVAVVRA